LKEKLYVPKITFVEFNDRKHVVDAPENISVMQAAKTNAVPGIDADCGGNCSCATCRVYVDPAWTEIVGKPHELESDMLDFVKDIKDNIRLSCQITVTKELDGLIVRMPRSQG
jgi:2Fe-2S ferredoxin